MINGPATEPLKVYEVQEVEGPSKFAGDLRRLS